MYNTVKIFYEELVEAGIIKTIEPIEPIETNLKGGEQEWKLQEKELKNYVLRMV